MAYIDPVAFHRVVSALVDNAVRFTAAGAVVVAFGADSDHAVLSVTDTGVGMTPEFAARASEPFLQASEGFARTHEGLGLGLTLASRLTRAMGGTITVETAPSRGTTVRVELPSSKRPSLSRRSRNGTARPAPHSIVTLVSAAA
jgi:signal transduction histidine kinase